MTGPSRGRVLERSGFPVAHLVQGFCLVLIRVARDLNRARSRPPDHGQPQRCADTPRYAGSSPGSWRLPARCADRARPEHSRSDAVRSCEIACSSLRSVTPQWARTGLENARPPALKRRTGTAFMQTPVMSSRPLRPDTREINRQVCLALAADCSNCSGWVSEIVTILASAEREACLCMLSIAHVGRPGRMHHQAGAGSRVRNG
jgi:hypothetical protein